MQTFGSTWHGALRGARALILPLFLVTNSWAASTAIVFNPSSVSSGPFPSNVLTKIDPSTATHLRVQMPADEATCNPNGHASVCSNSDLLNALDGFSVNPRVMACFSGPVDTNTIKQGMYILPVGNPSAAIPLNQIVTDSNSHCVYGKPQNVLNQASNYLLVVTSALHDSAGNAVTADTKYNDCLKASDPYCQSLQTATTGLTTGPGVQVVTASLFTTMSATSWLQNAYKTVNSLPGIYLPAGFPNEFDVSNLKSVTWQPSQTSIGSQDIPLTELSGVDKIAFGLFFSPNYLNNTGTITGNSIQPISLPGLPSLPLPGFTPVSFHVFIPSGNPPPGGWPVAIYGHGLSDNQFGAPTYIASTFAQNGFATLAIEITGHGFGPASTVKVTSKSGYSSIQLTPGRGVLLPNATAIGAQDGCIVPGAVAIRDCGRQTAVDLFALIKTIRDTNGLYLGLNENRISYVGQSFGSIYGSLFHAVEPNVKTAAINAGGGTFTDVARLSIPGQPLAGGFLASVGLLPIPGPQPFGPYPFRDQPPLGFDSSDSTGALEMEAAFEASDWLGMLGDPLAFASHFKTQPLPGVPAKNTLFQFGLGDLEVPNPTESALVRAADGIDTTWFYRIDRTPQLACFQPPGAPFPLLPHRILSNPSIHYPPENPIALAEQQQVASFFAGVNVNPNTFVPATPPIFEQLTLGTLPESLNFQNCPH